MSNQIAIIDKAKAVLPAKEQFNAANSFAMNYGQETGFAVMAMQQNPYLLNCMPDTVKSSIISVALTGISLNPALKYAYLVPRKGKEGLACCLDISYIGMIKILTDAGAVKSVNADVVYEKDVFKYSKGSEPFLKHEPNILEDRGNPIGVYAIAYFRDGGSQFDIMSRSDVEKVRAMSESWKAEASRKFSPWEKWADEMWKKTALKRLFKILPKTNFTDQLIATLSNEHTNEMADIDTKNEFLEKTFEDIQEPEVIESKTGEQKEKEIFDNVQEELKEEGKK